MMPEVEPGSGFKWDLLLSLHLLLEERSTKRAADRLGKAQSAVHRDYKQLCRHYEGDPLYVKEGSDRVLTPLARQLAPRVARIVQDVQGILPERVLGPEGNVRTFLIMTSDYAIYVLLSSVLDEIVGQAPGVTIEIELIQRGYLDQLRSGRVDLLIMPTTMVDEDTRQQFGHLDLFTDRFVLAGPPRSSTRWETRSRQTS